MPPTNHMLTHVQGIGFMGVAPSKSSPCRSIMLIEDRCCILASRNKMKGWTPFTSGDRCSRDQQRLLKLGRHF